jgi:hypothetical protein
MLIRALAVFGGLLLVSGCAIHPLPEDVTGVDTPDIVKQIRCETREALRGIVIEWLSEVATRDPLAEQLARQYTSDPDSISGFGPGLFPGPNYAQVRSVVQLFYDAGIAYSFDLTMTEDNDLTTDISFLKPFTQPKFTLGINAGAKRQRSNQRSFTVTDTFSYLLTRLNTEVRGRRYCDGKIVRANYTYPIAGRIGVDKLAKDFIQMTLFENLGKPGAAPTMADKLTFTTRINASATPKIEFTPVSDAFQITNVSFTASAVRSDVHQVTVALAVAPSGMSQLDPFRSYLFSAERSAGYAPGARVAGRAGTLVIGRRVTGGGTPAEALAVIAIDQLKSRELQLIPPP